MSKDLLRPVRSAPSQNQLGLIKELWTDLDDEGAELGIADLINHRSLLLQKEISSAVQSAMRVLTKSARVMEAELSELRAKNEKLQAGVNGHPNGHRSNGVNEHEAEVLSVVPQATSRPASMDRNPASLTADDGLFVQDLTRDLDDADLHTVQDVGSEAASIPLSDQHFPCSPIQVWRSDRSSNLVEMDEGTSVKSADEAEFEVLPVWTVKRSYKKSFTNLKSAMSIRMRSPSGDDINSDFDFVRKFKLSTASDITAMDSERGPRRRSLVLHPNSAFRGIWDISSLLLVVYDMVVIPFQLFEPPDNVFTVAMAWITRCFWTFDMPLSCLTGLILPDGSVQMDCWFVTKRYLKTWFALDFFIVSIDWIELIWLAGGAVAYARIGKASRIFRIIRLLRLLRIVRIREVIKVIIERLRSERLIIMAHILKMTCIIAGVAHVMACIWYGLGSEGDDDLESWIKAHLKPHFSLGYRYFTSLHWAVSQFSGGMDEIRPQRQLERIYAIICFLIGFIIAAVFVSSVTSSMTQLHLLTTHQSKQFLVLRRFLSEHSISNKLCMRVLRSAAHALAEQQRFVPEANVEMLTYVSHALRTHLHFEMFAPHFAQHPWFARYNEECPHVMRRVCHAGTLLTFCSHGDAIFHAGEMPEEPKFYILLSGKLRYTMAEQVSYVDENNWLAEPTLWTRWTHRGSLVAISDSRMLMLDANRFQSIVSQFDHDEFDPKTYAAEFVSLLNAQGADASDLPMPTDALNGDYVRQSPMQWQTGVPGILHSFRKSLRTTKTALLGDS